MIAGIIRMRVLIKGGPYMRKYGTYCQYCQLGFSSKIEVPQLGLARQFQLELISTIYVCLYVVYRTVAYYILCSVSTTSVLDSKVIQKRVLTNVRLDLGIPIHTSDIDQ